MRVSGRRCTVGKHSIRGVLTGEELDVRGTDSKRAKSHRRSDVPDNVVAIDGGKRSRRMASIYIDGDGNQRVRVF